MTKRVAVATLFHFIRRGSWICVMSLTKRLTSGIRKDLGQSGVYSVGLFHHQVDRRIIGHLKDPVTFGIGEITVYLNVNVYGLETVIGLIWLHEAEEESRIDLHLGGYLQPVEGDEEVF